MPRSDCGRTIVEASALILETVTAKPRNRPNDYDAIKCDQEIKTAIRLPANEDGACQQIEAFFLY